MTTVVLMSIKLIVDGNLIAYHKENLFNQNAPSLLHNQQQQQQKKPYFWYQEPHHSIQQTDRYTLYKSVHFNKFRN